eukprot:CAMPEP_0177581456 /NCGR_PEP_ID=MMETSP0419_2-20121207/2159_1 /TAXON_ID=582737 /ORGANISM="Tetraselmis sp., Strain GSL018" /LENGTH=313 /DNA_ID=CAMNT_0019070503 /DNA_START=153 /DNA_END=1092 /DNA_ORIENTATION=-
MTTGVASRAGSGLLSSSKRWQEYDQSKAAMTLLRGMLGAQDQSSERGSDGPLSAGPLSAGLSRGFTPSGLTPGGSLIPSIGRSAAGSGIATPGAGSRGIGYSSGTITPSAASAVRYSLPGSEEVSPASILFGMKAASGLKMGPSISQSLAPISDAHSGQQSPLAEDPPESGSADGEAQERTLRETTAGQQEAPDSALGCGAASRVYVKLKIDYKLNHVHTMAFVLPAGTEWEVSADPPVDLSPSEPQPEQGAGAAGCLGAVRLILAASSAGERVCVPPPPPGTAPWEQTRRRPSEDRPMYAYATALCYDNPPP